MAEKLVVVITRGLDDERSSVAWSIANAGVASDMDVTVFLAAAGVDWVRKGAAEVAHLNPVDPPMKDLVGNIMANGNYNVTSGGYEWNFCNDQTNAVEAKNNYWVAADNGTIDAGICDDEEGKGKVEFYPFATGPVPCAPIPELSSIVLFSGGLLALAGYIRIRRKV